MPIADKFNPNFINKKVQDEIDYFLKNEPVLRADVEYVYKIGVPDRPKAYLMLQFAQALGVEQNIIMPFVIVADLMMAAAMNDDDIIDDNDKRCGEPTLWKTKGINSTIVVTAYMYALIFSILKKYRPDPSSRDFKPYLKSENLLTDYFRVMNIAQYKTTISANSLEGFTLDDLENLAVQKASLLFQFCSAVPAYFANKLIKESEDFGYQLGIVRQYVSDVHDFLEVPPEEDYNKKGAGGDSARMEDYFTHQPNLILVLTGTSNKLNTEERDWFYKNWAAIILENDRALVTKKVIELIHKTDAIEESKPILRKIRDRIKDSLSGFSDEEFKNYMSDWAFRSFSID
jgi:geranylgeranyl pyrophosphate synthase